MPILALMAVLLTLTSPTAIAQTPQASVTLTYEDEIGRDWSNEDSDEGYDDPRSHDDGDRYNDDDSANGPDDDGWDPDEYERSEQA